MSSVGTGAIGSLPVGGGEPEGEQPSTGQVQVQILGVVSRDGEAFQIAGQGAVTVTLTRIPLSGD